MAKRYERATGLEAGPIDLETGEFSMVMATEGEAADGHILSMRGLEFESELPLQLDHGRSAVANLGTVTDMRRDVVEGVPVYRGTGRIRLTGDGEALAARRDVADAIHKGALRGVSLTWESESAVERRDLPKSHPAHVSRNEKSARKRFGLYFENARGVEQSIVAIPADRGALIGRAETAEGETRREMWNTLIHRLDDMPNGSREAELIEALEAEVASLEQRLIERDAADTASGNLPTEPQALDAYLRSLSAEIQHGGARARESIRDALGDVILELTGRSRNE
jgi:hypothetical protein